MCGGGGGGGDGGAAQREKQRQSNIQAGYNKIQQIFGGYTTGVNPVSGGYQSGATYYLADGTPVQYGMQEREVDGDITGYNEGDPIYGPKKKQSFGGYTRNGKFVDLGDTALYGGTQTTTGFDDNFYNKRQQDYVDYAMPQLEDQYTQAVKKLTFMLAQSGRLNSSTRGNRFAELQKDYDMQKTGVIDEGRRYANDARSGVERARGDLVALNASLADPATVAAEAQNRLSSLQQAPAFDALAPLFTNAGEGLATQADLERRQSSRYNTGLFTPAASGRGRSREIR
jgi:hypothetical protein